MLKPAIFILFLVRALDSLPLEQNGTGRAARWVSLGKFPCQCESIASFSNRAYSTQPRPTARMHGNLDGLLFAWTDYVLESVQCLRRSAFSWFNPGVQSRNLGSPRDGSRDFGLCRAREETFAIFGPRYSHSYAICGVIGAVCVPTAMNSARFPSEFMGRERVLCPSTELWLNY